MGGQVADHGFLRGGACQFAVTDVQKNKGGKYMRLSSSAVMAVKWVKSKRR